MHVAIKVSELRKKLRSLYIDSFLTIKLLPSLTPDVHTSAIPDVYSENVYSDYNNYYI